MLGTEQDQLSAGECMTYDNGERMGRSARGGLVLLRRRRHDDGFLVTIDTGEADAPETITQEWRTAAATFDRLMQQH